MSVGNARPSTPVRAYHYYVYYRVASADDAALRDRIERFLSDVEAAARVSATLMARRDEPATWMEVYDGVADPEAFERTLAELGALARVDELLAPGERRHVECFVPV